MDALPLNNLRKGMSQDVMSQALSSPGMAPGAGTSSLAASLGTRFSVASHVSVSSYFTEDYGRLDVMDDEDLKQLVEELKEANHVMELENELMIRYLVRNAEYDENTLRQVMDRVAERAWRVIRMGPTQAQGRQSNSSSNIALVAGRSVSRATLDSTGERRKNASVTSTHMRSKETSNAKLTSSPTTTPARRLSVSPSVMSGGGGVGINLDRPGQRLNLAGKLEMMSRELADGKRELDRLEAFFEHRSVVLRVKKESATIMAEELDREQEAFERDVAVGGIDPMTGRVPAERFIRHVAEWIRSMSQLGEKLRLRTSTLFSQLRRVQAQLAAKAELGDTLTPVDFEQLHIDNKRFLATIEQKNLQVIELKRMAGDCALQLSVHKKALLADRAIEDFLRSIGDERQRQCDVMYEERSAVEDQIERLQNRLESLNTLTDNFTAPSVLDYARLRAKVAEQQHQHRIWKRRVDLQESALLVATSNMRSSTAAARRAHRHLRSLREAEAKKFCDFWFSAEKTREQEEPGERPPPPPDEPESEDSWIDMPDHFEPLPAQGRRPCAEIEEALDNIRRMGRGAPTDRLLGPGVGPVAAAPWKKPLPPLAETPGEDYELPGETWCPFAPFNYPDEGSEEMPQEWGVPESPYYRPDSFSGEMDLEGEGEYSPDRFAPAPRSSEVESFGEGYDTTGGISEEPTEGDESPDDEEGDLPPDDEEQEDEEEEDASEEEGVEQSPDEEEQGEEDEVEEEEEDGGENEGKKD